MEDTFRYFFFEPLSFERFVAHIGQRYTLSRDDAVFVYKNWLNEFYHHATVFYHAQYAAHEDSVWRAFCAEHDIPEHESSDLLREEDYGWLWGEYKIQTGVGAHYRAYMDHITLCKSRKEMLFPGPNGPGLNPIDDVAARLGRLMTLRVPERDINALWFNTTINNPPDLQAQLRRFPYPRYLQTDHWKRVRAAMLLIHRALCQEEDCFNAGDSWYFNESDIHVHHLSYKNKGNERYEDLMLLCRMHHERRHKTLDITT